MLGLVKTKKKIEAPIRSSINKSMHNEIIIIINKLKTVFNKLIEVSKLSNTFMPIKVNTKQGMDIRKFRNSTRLLE
jgi:hypothetical protein